jgi:hypothetical protein
MKCLIRRAAGFAAHAALLINLSAPAGADPSAPNAVPIKVGGCSVGEGAQRMNPLIGGVQPARTSGVTIGYVNGAEVAASEIHFRVKYHGRTLNFVDRGSFPAQAKFTRTFTNISEVFTGNSADCSVMSARFVDGSRWDAATPSPSPAASP